ncbi:uncharacterized protein [Clytia hemisphaerica]|uniref:uncharacterized protein n=1 Tax=Clytia hemisphaerica TaxID=252671 RepID=UPI0034D7AA84
MHHETLAAESKYAVLATGDKSVGKSSIQKLVAHGQGIPSTSHPFAAAGGDGSGAGTTLTKQLQILALSNMVIIFNELEIASPMVGKALNQAHDNYGCHSVGRGTLKPKASLLASSNQLIPHIKLDTRIQIMTCEEGEDFDKVVDKRALDNDLTKLVESNPGFLIAWCTWHNDMVCKAMERFADKVANEIISSRNDIKSRLLDAKLDNVIIAFLTKDNQVHAPECKSVVFFFFVEKMKVYVE